MKTKAEFLASPKRANLSSKEQNERWRQYKASLMADRTRTGYSRNTRIKVTTDHKNKTIANLRLSHCAADYAHALVMPFSLHKPACIPDLHAIPSKKIRVVNRGTFSTGTGGYGHIVQAPWCTASDASDVIYSDASYALGTTFQVSGVGVATQFNNKLPYTQAQFAGNSSGGIRARLVGCGLRIRYIGPESSRSGQIVGFREPDNENVAGLTYSRALEMETSATYRNTEKWHYVFYRPSNPSEYEFSPNPCVPSDVGYTVTSSRVIQGFAITGTTDINGSPSPAPFEWETVRFIEYVGNITSITRTHVDISGMSVVRNALPVKSTTSSPVAYVKRTAASIAHGLQEAAPVVGAGMLAHHMLGGGAAAEEAVAATTPALEEAAESSIPLLEYLPQGVAEAAEAMAPVVATAMEML